MEQNSLKEGSKSSMILPALHGQEVEVAAIVAAEDDLEVEVIQQINNAVNLTAVLRKN